MIRQPFASGDFLPFWAYGVETDHHLLHDLDADPWQTENRAGAPDEKEAVDLLRAALDEVDAPAEQYERLGLALIERFGDISRPERSPIVAKTGHGRRRWTSPNSCQR